MLPKHIAQTSTEVKKAYKQKGPAISDRTHKQLQRGYELEQRAAREREAEQRRKLAKEKRIEREKKEEQIRKQIGVGLATQLIGYSHTQANLKQGMEAFLGISKKKKDEERKRKEEEKRREEELARKLENIAQDIDKEPFDDDEDIDDAMLGLPHANAQDGECWVDDELDDHTLLEALGSAMSDPMEEAIPGSIHLPSATAPSTPQRPILKETPAVKATVPTPQHQPEPQEQGNTCDDVEFTRTHGPVNKTVELALERLPGELIELLSQDTATTTPEWAPSSSLLYKLNPAGLPPHRLRIKVGCVVVCLRDLNTSSQLSKSQHVRILRVENERLECLTLDGQLAGTKTVITKVPFPASYRNDTRFRFTRTQYPVRFATDYILDDTPHEIQPSGFKLPSINGQIRPPVLSKRPLPPMPQASSNPSFKLPGLPASKAQRSRWSKPVAPVPATTTTLVALDGWDDFLDSGTQIARELLAEGAPQRISSGTSAKSSAIIQSAPLLCTQDPGFSLDDLDDLDDEQEQIQIHSPKATHPAKVAAPAVKGTEASRSIKAPPSVKPGPLSRTANIRRLDQDLPHAQPASVRPQKVLQPKAKRRLSPALNHPPPTKKPCIASSVALPTIKASTTKPRRFSDFGMSTQEAFSFFDDDDDLAFGSPPIAV